MNLQRMPIMMESAWADSEVLVSALTKCLYWDSLCGKWMKKLVMRPLASVSQNGLLFFMSEECRLQGTWCLVAFIIS